MQPQVQNSASPLIHISLFRESDAKSYIIVTNEPTDLASYWVTSKVKSFEARKRVSLELSIISVFLFLLLTGILLNIYLPK